MSVTRLKNHELVLTPQESLIEGAHNEPQKGRERTFRRLDAIRQSTFKVGVDSSTLASASVKPLISLVF